MIRVIHKFTPELVGLFLLYAGLYKVAFPAEAALALIAFGLGQALAQATVAAVSILELYVGVLLVFKVNLKYGLGTATVLMLLFSFFLFYLSIMANPPSCGCMGLASVFSSNKHNAIAGLARNCIVLWLLKGSYDHYYPKPVPAAN